MLSVAALWWLLALGWPSALPERWYIAPGLAHAVLMCFSFMPLFFAGFLFSAGPRWLALPALRAAALLPGVLACLLGWTVFLAGVHLAAPLAAAGLAGVALAWSHWSRRFWRLLRSSTRADRTHARVIAAACSVGGAALWAVSLAVAFGSPALAESALALGLWGFLAPVYLAVLHRLIPFFTTLAVPWLDARWPRWLLWSWLALLALQALFALGRQAGLPVAGPAVLLDAAGGGLLVALAVRWNRLPGGRLRLPLMLQAGVLWLGLGLCLQAGALLVGHLPPGRLGLAPAALHAVTMGFFGSVLLAMVSRMACGLGGRTVVADDRLWLLFKLLQLAVLLRLLAAWAGPAWLPWAAATWAVAVFAWSMRYLRWYGRPRADGRPG